MNDWQTKMGELLLAGDTEQLKKATKEALGAGHSSKEILEMSMTPAMEQLGERFSKGEAFLPELLLAADTMKGALEILRQAVGKEQEKPRATMLIGTVEGDIHDLGKNLVKMMLEGAGFHVVDLGTNVSVEKFLQVQNHEKANLVGLSALLTTTMGEMEKIVRKLKAEQPETKFIIGGAPITQDFADKIGADGYAPDAHKAVKVAREILGV